MSTNRNPSDPYDHLENINRRLRALETNGVPGVRDFFATSALSFLARDSTKEWSYEQIAAKAYGIADAMMKERNATTGNN